MKTLAGLLKDLERDDPSHSLVFETKAGEISPGYHITELKYSTSKGIDCAGHIENWTEARLQLLDGRGSSHMTVGKFSSIISKSLHAMPELQHASLMVEFGHDNTDLQLMSLNSSQREGSRVVIRLGNSRAQCKPAERFKSKSNGHNQCCAEAEASATTPSCCTTDEQHREVRSCCA
ncbi:MAG: DUF6428 family protein [Pseudomonadota bacterium]